MKFLMSGFRYLIGLSFVLTAMGSLAQSRTASPSYIDLTLIPPSPVTDQINLDIRAGLKNNTQATKTLRVKLYLDKVGQDAFLYGTKTIIRPKQSRLVRFSWPTEKHPGQHKIILVCQDGHKLFTKESDIQIIDSHIRSTQKIDGAFMGFYHWSETEGRFWNKDIKNMSDEQWRELVNAQHQLGMDIVVMQELFRNQMYAGQHHIESEGYKGRAYYPSKLFPGRMPITAKDPVEDVLAQADANGMHVFVAIGLYAWFDFSKGSLDWHRKVANELWTRYGHHPSFYGWYVSEEMDGGLGDTKQRHEIVDFFAELSQYIHRLTPDKPLMLATNSLHIHGAEETYKKLLPHLDILCPFGFHRMPPGDYTGEEAANLLQGLCNSSSTHLWMDMEVFDFGGDNALVPRSINGLISDLRRFPNFEKIICYQFPGLLNSPSTSMRPGGENTVKLYLNYKAYLDTMRVLGRKIN